jgi:hypothetical protein
MSMMQASIQNVIDTTIAFRQNVNLSKSQIIQHIIQAADVRISGITAMPTARPAPDT